ncbi:hypothetical protein E1B28_004148 [Marasmius oreades]|uniref:Uncharacterized protein n=1 Tax=Marasmius oreades TaxID=181124 RepID=A0A9P8ACW2_9AGAR|nr:uncharacterized protein E1B28_004148 [Marasmius oreades]KAG7096735.1 hypothetical protein E1B28_004148 [Marasmius oreades]
MQNPPSSALFSDGSPFVSDLLDQVQLNLNELKIRFESVSSTESYIVHLERNFHDLENTSKVLEKRNTALERRVKELEKHCRKVIQERDDTKKKLGLYRRVIHDAFNSTDEGRSFTSDETWDLETHRQSEGSNWGILGEAEEEAHHSNPETRIYKPPAEDLQSELDALEVENQLLPPPTSASETSIATAPVPFATQSKSLLQNEPLRGGLLLSNRRIRIKHEPVSSEETSLVGDVERRGSRAVDAQMASTTGVFSQNSDDNGNQCEWRIQFNDPPKASHVVAGPMSWRKMEENVGLDDNVVRDLQKLLDPSSYKLGVAFMTDMAFVHDPFFLEDLSENKSYLIDWGDKRVNEKLAQHIQRAGECCNSVFHTFVYVVGRRRWYYVSALQWTVGKVWDVWPTLTQPDKEAIGLRLWNRNQSGRQTDMIMENLDSGELQQFCVELSASEHLIELSRERTASMGLRVRI